MLSSCIVGCYSVFCTSITFPVMVGFRYLDVLPGWRLIDAAPNPHPSIPPRFCPAVSDVPLLWFPARLHQALHLITPAGFVARPRAANSFPSSFKTEKSMIDLTSIVS